MVGYFRALATDFDGTLTHNGRTPNREVLAALARFRARGGLVLLVTGRILGELRADFAEVESYVDGIVAENGCVFWSPAGIRRLAEPVDPALTKALANRAVQVRSGLVILAGRAADRGAVLEEVHRLELDCQLVFNRSELMILPSGVSKGTGLFEVLGDLGVSRHSTMGVGDAENDRALLDTCEVGAAVADSVTSLASFADVVLAGGAGVGVVELIDHLLAQDAPALHSRRRRLRLGTRPDGGAASLPSSQLNLLICGPSRSGKSHLVGLCAERLIALGYCVLVIDPEGDHQGLGELRGVVVIDHTGGMPTPERVAARFEQRFMSVVLDLSSMPVPARHTYLARLAVAVERTRSRHGLPHWIIADEAHTTIGDLGGDSPLFGDDVATGRWGFALATYRPDLLAPEALDRMDAVISMCPSDGARPLEVDRLAAITGRDPEAIVADMSTAVLPAAYLAQAEGTGESGLFRLASRVTEHHRHWHKYTDGELPREHCFYFRDSADTLVAVVGNMRRLRDVVRTCGDDVLRHHARGHDLSNWVRGVLANATLAAEVREVEERLRVAAVDVDDARSEYLGLLRAHYGV